MDGCFEACNYVCGPHVACSFVRVSAHATIVVGIFGCFESVCAATIAIGIGMSACLLGSSDLSTRMLISSAFPTRVAGLLSCPVIIHSSRCDSFITRTLFSLWKGLQLDSDCHDNRGYSVNNSGFHLYMRLKSMHARSTLLVYARQLPKTTMM